MWRTAKADVSREMGIPPQHHHTTTLRLSAIERHWYNRCGIDATAGMGPCNSRFGNAQRGCCKHVRMSPHIWHGSTGERI